jgi:2-aminobenzoate-CoA ligase
MKDIYAQIGAVPVDCLVDGDLQPDYARPVTTDVPGNANAGVYIADRQVTLGNGGRVAAIDAASGNELTFKELADKSTGIASALVRRGVLPGDRIAYHSPNVIDVLVIMAAIWKTGAIVVPIPTQATAKDIRFYIEDTSARFLIVHVRSNSIGQLAKASAQTTIENIFMFGAHNDDSAIKPGFVNLTTVADGETAPWEPLPLAANAVAIVWHTGGTTGTPKGCYHTHRRFLLAGFALAAQTAIQPGDRWAVAAPIGHALGIIYNTIFTLLHGATSVLIEAFSDPIEVLNAVKRHNIDTLTALAPSWAKMLTALDANPALPRPVLKRAYAMWQSASSSEIYDRWKKLGVQLLNNFGSTSFATWVLTPVHGQASPAGALGRPLPGYRVEAVEVTGRRLHVLPRGDIGQMAVRGPSGLTYWDRPEFQRRDVIDGWTLQDDLIRYDEQGHVHYLGRTDYMISTGGHKVAPAEVENALSEHAAIHEVSVVPGPCPINREMVVAYVVLRPGARPSPELATELRDFVKSVLVAYKAPRRIEFVDSLPRDLVGKVQTKIVKQWAYQSEIAS